MAGVGLVEHPESVAAVRELREECSLAAAQWRSLGAFWAAPAYSTERVHVYEARELDPAEGRLEPDEDITVEHRALRTLPAALSDATSIAAFALWADGSAHGITVEGDGPSA